MASEEIELAGQQIVVAGGRGSGKSTFVQHVLRILGDGALVYDMNREHDAFERYLPDHRRGEEAVAEADGVVSRMVTDNDPSRRPALLVLEEANRYVSQGNIPEAVGELVDLGRHYKTPLTDGVAVMYVTRRVAQLDTDVTELADYIAVFGPGGKNSRRRLNDEVAGLGDAAAELDGYEWLLAFGDGTFTRMAPVEPGDTTGSL